MFCNSFHARDFSCFNFFCCPRSNICDSKRSLMMFLSSLGKKNKTKFNGSHFFIGCLLDSATRPPDVPPRNPTMNRLNGRLASAPPSDPSQDFEPSCLVRTPSGNVYIPTGTLSKFIVKMY